MYSRCQMLHFGLRLRIQPPKEPVVETQTARGDANQARMAAAMAGPKERQDLEAVTTFNLLRPPRPYSPGKRELFGWPIRMGRHSGVESKLVSAMGYRPRSSKAAYKKTKW